jgi:lipopolysaccharide assembly protein A
MRLLCFLILLAAAGAVAAFAIQNQQEITLTFLDYGVTASVALILGCTFLLGMISGWTIVGMLRRSFNRVLESDRQYANR